MARYAYLNNKYINFKDAKIHIEDRGFQFSDSIYEVIAYKDNNFIDLKFHLQRLRYSLKELNIKFYFTNLKLIKIINKVVYKIKLK